MTIVEPLNLQKLFFLEIAKEPRDGFPGSTNDLRDVLVGQCHREPYLAPGLVVVCAKVQQKPRQLFACRVREPDGAHFRNSRMVRFTKLPPRRVRARSAGNHLER